MELLPLNAWSYDWSNIQPNETYRYEDVFILDTTGNTINILPLIVNSGPYKGLRGVTPTKEVQLSGLLTFKNGVNTLGGYTIIHVKQLNINNIVSNLTSNISNYESSLRNAKVKLNLFQNLQTTNPELFI